MSGALRVSGCVGLGGLRTGAWWKVKRRVRSDGLRGGEGVGHLQGEVALGAEQVGGQVEGVLGGGLQVGQCRHAGNLGQVDRRKDRHGLDPLLRGVDGQLLTLLETGDELLTGLLYQLRDLGLGHGLGDGLARGLGGCCCHGELLESLRTWTASPPQQKTYSAVLGMSSTLLSMWHGSCIGSWFRAIPAGSSLAAETPICLTLDNPEDMSDGVLRSDPRRPGTT